MCVGGRKSGRVRNKTQESVATLHNILNVCFPHMLDDFFFVGGDDRRAADAPDGDGSATLHESIHPCCRAKYTYGTTRVTGMHDAPLSALDRVGQKETRRFTSRLITPSPTHNVLCTWPLRFVKCALSLTTITTYRSTCASRAATMIG